MEIGTKRFGSGAGVETVDSGPGLPNLGAKPCLHVFGPKPRSPDLLVPISAPALDLAPRSYTTLKTTALSAKLNGNPFNVQQLSKLLRLLID